MSTQETESRQTDNIEVTEGTFESDVQEIQVIKTNDSDEHGYEFLKTTNEGSSGNLVLSIMTDLNLSFSVTEELATSSNVENIKTS